MQTTCQPFSNVLKRRGEADCVRVKKSGEPCSVPELGFRCVKGGMDFAEIFLAINSK